MNKKIKHVWKVVRLHPTTGKYVSAVVGRNDIEDYTFLLSYEIGKETKANIGKIFTFRTRKLARQFLQNELTSRHKPKIMKCLATNPVEGKLRCPTFVSDMRIFWVRTEDVRTWSVPSGTIWADAVFPIEFAR